MTLKVLVTGGYGMMGKHLQEFATPEFVFLSRSDCDLTNTEDTFKVFERNNPDVVVHLAAKVGGLYDNIKYNYDYYIQNSRMNLNVIEACKKFKVKRLINVLSTCIFPDNCETPLQSKDILNGPPHDSNRGYAYAKRDLYIGSSFLDDSCKVINLIPTNLYGEYDTFNDTSSHVIPALIYKLVRDKTVTILGSGNAKRQFLYAQDFAHIIVNFIGLDIKESFTNVVISPNVSEEVSINELAQLLQYIYDGSSFVNTEGTPDSDGQMTKTTSDTELKRYLPHFEFTSLFTGLSNVLVHYKNVNL